MTGIRRAIRTSIIAVAALSVLVLSAAATERSKLVQALAGRYSKHFLNMMMDGEKYWSDDIVEIVPVAEDAAYVRASLQFANGHSCDISGVAKVENGQLVYRDPTTRGAEDRQCVLRLSRVGLKLQLDDGLGSCHDSYCGMRGTLTWALPFGSKRPISYMDRLKASPDYVAALAKWRGDH